MRKLLFAALIICLLSLIGCSKDENSPNDLMKEYVDLWNESEFDKMYGMIAEEEQEMYEREDFVDRYEKVYKDLDISDLEINYADLDKEEEDAAYEKGAATYTVEVKMDSMAGPIEFKREMNLSLEEVPEAEEEGEKGWFIQWNPGFIFPDLADGGKIRIETEKAKRGEILDRNQMPLAINDIAYEIGVVPNLFEDEAAEKEEIAQILNLTVDKIDESLNASWVEEDYFVPLKTIAKTQEETLDKLLAIPAVTSVETTGRAYPSGEASAHLTGYVGQVTAEDMEKNPDRNLKEDEDRKSTRLNSSHVSISYAVFCLKKK